MAGYLILGAGKFGRLALARLAAQDPQGAFVVVDRAPAALAAAGSLHDHRVVLIESEAIAFLADRLGRDAPWDWLIPVVPVHVAFAWLVAGPLQNGGWEAVPAPESLRQLTPTAIPGPHGELYLSRARHRCPDDCAASDPVCPVSGESRELPLYREVAALSLPGWRVLVIPSRQLAPGVGGYPPRRLWDLAGEVTAAPGNVLIVTACRCHGVAHGIRRSGSEVTGV